MPGSERRPFRLSLRARLTLAFATAMVLIVIALGAVVYVWLGNVLLQNVDTTLRSRADAVLAQFDSGVLPRLHDERLLDPDEFFAQILDTSARPLSGTGAGEPLPRLSVPELRAVHGPTFLTRPASADADAYRLLAVPGRVQRQDVVLVMGATLGDRGDALHDLLALYALATPLAIALSWGIGWGVAGAALRPVDQITRRAAEITRSGQVQARLPVPATGDEIARLGVTMNDLLSALEDALERERRFVDRASHELRTPLAILKAELDLAAMRPRTEGELNEVLTAAGRETDRVVELAEDLLVLARSRPDGLPVHRVEVGMRDLVEQICSRYRARAQQSGRNIDVHASCALAYVDPARIRQAVANMIENALAHGAGAISLNAEQRQGRLRIEVADEGAGFPVDLLPAVFEPFTRTPTRDETASGAGLGLAIVRAVARAHDGTAEAGNLPQGGAQVTIEIPCGGSSDGDERGAPYMAGATAQLEPAQPGPRARPAAGRGR